jgi:hypothetical protein
MATPDRAPLAALVAYQQEVVFGYTIALRQAPLERTDHSTLRRFLRDSEQAAATLRTALEGEGGKAAQAPDPTKAPPPSAPTRAGYLSDLITAEDSLVASYYAALQSLDETRHVQGAAAFMAQAGRRLVILRHLAGRELLPRTFETGGA